MQNTVTDSQDMRAAVLVEPGRFEIRRVAKPQPEPHEVRLRVQGCGICASTLPPFHGREWFDYPLAPGDLGHEPWGIIDACGDDVASVSVGQRVAVLSHKAFAEYDLADAETVVSLPDTLAGQAFPGEAFGCVMNIWRRTEFQPGQTMAVVGVGFLGAALIRLAAAAGARVIAISRSEFSRDQAVAMGAQEVLSLDEPGGVAAAVERLTDGRGCECVIEATGKAEPLNVAGALTAVGGRLVIAGFHQDGPREIDMQLWNWRGIDVINAHERNPAVVVQGMRAAVDAVDAGRLDLEALVTHRYPLQELGPAMTAVQQRAPGLTKAVVLMDGD
ncbi:MAG TPA: zinc-binding dehydrogenase [Salinisphaeraceae bacterium]|nr:zinc-binding dehydrogenase [Salinisphaeraceae bacterium]